MVQKSLDPKIEATLKIILVKPDLYTRN